MRFLVLWLIFGFFSVVQAQTTDITQRVGGAGNAPQVTEVALLAWENEWSKRIHAALLEQSPEEERSAILREQVLFDGTRVDLLTPDYAIEIDWGHKWAEGVGQSLHYAMQTDRLPGIILLLKDRKAESEYVQICKAIGTKYGIKIWALDTATARLYQLDGTWVPIPPLVAQPAATGAPK